MNIGEYGVSSYSRPSIGGMFSAQETLQLKGAMAKSQTLSILGGLPASGDYVLSPSLLGQIYDAKAVTPAVVNNYLKKVESAYGPESGVRNVEAEEKQPEKTYMTPQEEVAQKLEKLEHSGEEEPKEDEIEANVVVEQAEEGVNPFQ